MGDDAPRWPVREIERLYVELDKRDLTIERQRLDLEAYKTSSDERLRKLELANAISGGLDGYKKYLVATIIAVLGILGGMWAAKGKLW